MARLDSRQRLIRITPGNLRQNHIYIREHLDFFPLDCIGPSRKKNGSVEKGIEIVLDGLGQVISTDIGADPRTNKPRGFFRGRSWVRRFFEHHNVNARDTLAIERLSARRYRLSLAPKHLTAVEFFAGIGLVRLALERQGWEVVFSNDIDPDKAEIYRKNWPKNDHLVVRDIHTLKPEEIPSCTLATASFPCNDLSIAGRWEGLNGTQSSAFWGFVEILRGMKGRRPPIIMLENVLGFLMRNEGRDLEEALLALNKLGYAMDAIVLNAIHWVPQSRARLFLIGKQAEPKQRSAFELRSSVRPKAVAAFIFAHPKILWDIVDVPSLPNPHSQLADIVQDLPDDDPHWWNKSRAEYFIRQLSERHLVEANKMIRGKIITYATAFRRVRNSKSMAELRTDGVAGCLRTPRGGSGRQILFKAGQGKFQVRLLTAGVREAARSA